MLAVQWPAGPVGQGVPVLPPRPFLCRRSLQALPRSLAVPSGTLPPRCPMPEEPRDRWEAGPSLWIGVTCGTRGFTSWSARSTASAGEIADGESPPHTGKPAPRIPYMSQLAGGRRSSKDRAAPNGHSVCPGAAAVCGWLHHPGPQVAPVLSLHPGVLLGSVLKAGEGDGSRPRPRVQSRSVTLPVQAACPVVLLPLAVRLLQLQGHGGGDGCVAGSPFSPAQVRGPGQSFQVSLCCGGCHVLSCSAQHHVLWLPGPVRPLPPSPLGLRSGLRRSGGTILAAAPFPD